MAPNDENGNDDGLPEAFEVFKTKMTIEKRLEAVHQQLLFARKDITALQKNAVYRDTCDANHKGLEQRLDRAEKEIKEVENKSVEGNRHGTSTVIAIIALILTVIVGAAALWPH